MKKTIQILGAVASLVLLIASLACAGSSQATSGQLMSQISSPAPTVTPQQAAPDDGVPRIKAEDAIKLFKDGKAMIVDTRDAGSFANMHIKGAINIPYADFQAGKHQKLPTDKELIFYCT